MSNITEGIIKDIKAIPNQFKGTNGKLDVKKLLIQYVPYIIAGYFINKVSYGLRISAGSDFFERLMSLCMDFGICFKNPLPSFNGMDLLWGIAGGVGFKMIMVYKQKNAKKYRKGEEYGSARWGNEKDIAPFIDPKFENNILLTETERLMMSGRPSNPSYARNKNVLVVGGSGSGKTRFFVKPNLMQMNCSYVVTDPKGAVSVR